MFRDKRPPFFNLCISLAFVIFSGCSGTIGGRAFSHKEPITDPDIHVDIYNPDKAQHGTTLLFDKRRPKRPRIIEVNMQGQIVWEYVLPGYMRQYTQPGPDVEWLQNNNILFLLPRKGVYEIDRDGNIVWSYLNNKVSHDADRLPNGNILVVWGGRDQIIDAQIKEINPEGKIVWSWYAKDHFYKPPYKDIRLEGWTHANAVTRLSNGNTIISLRNFNLVVEVDAQGSVVWSFDCGFRGGKFPHEPEIQPNGNMLISIMRPGPGRWDRAVEIERKSRKVVWEFSKPGVKMIRDVDRLPNGNTLIVERTNILEVTSEGEVVWQLGLKGVSGERARWSPDFPKFFYKAERITKGVTKGVKSLILTNDAML